MAVKTDKRALTAWCLYDWANSAFATVIITFIFSVYFARGIIGDETEGVALWSFAIGLSGFMIALAGPVMGAISDHYGARRQGVVFLTLLCIAATSLLWFAAPEATTINITITLTLVIVANVAFELAQIFYNAMLPHIVPQSLWGRLSGWAWGAGYIGGLFCLVLILFLFVGLGDIKPLIELPQEHSVHLRITGPLVALWFLVFSIPLFVFTTDTERSGVSLGQATRKGLAQLKNTIFRLRDYKNLVLFLLASAFYRDGLATLFAVGGIYASQTMGMSFQEILIFAIGLNVTAGIGAFLFAFLDDMKGSQKTVTISLIGLLAIAVPLLLTTDKTIFLGLSLLLGLFIGPTQAASRTLAARLTPPDMTNQTFGLYAFTGKSIAFLGPMVFGGVTLLYESQRAGMATILVFWLLGIIILAAVKESKKS